QRLIPPECKEELHKYITGLVRNRKSKLLAVHCMPDHTHLFVGFKPVMAISDFVKEIKVESNEFINGNRWSRGRFAWQTGYGAFSYSQSHIGNVIRYIQNQVARHQKQTFKQEYTKLLDKFQIAFQDNYLFEFFE